jgi:hypothetical protein
MTSPAPAVRAATPEGEPPVPDCLLPAPDQSAADAHGCGAGGGLPFGTAPIVVVATSIRAAAAPYPLRPRRAKVPSPPNVRAPGGDARTARHGPAGSRRPHPTRPVPCRYAPARPERSRRPGRGRPIVAGRRRAEGRTSPTRVRSAAAPPSISGTRAIPHPPPMGVAPGAVSLSALRPLTTPPRWVRRGAGSQSRRRLGRRVRPRRSGGGTHTHRPFRRRGRDPMISGTGHSPCVHPWMPRRCRVHARS